MHGAVSCTDLEWDVTISTGKDKLPGSYHSQCPHIQFIKIYAFDSWQHHSVSI